MAQRARLQEKSTPPPHVLAMTATPIPRTLALAVHGDMAVCAIDELPPGRLPVITHALHDSATDRKRVRHYCWERLRRQWGQPHSVHRQPAVHHLSHSPKGLSPALQVCQHTAQLLPFACAHSTKVEGLSAALQFHWPDTERPARLQNPYISLDMFTEQS